VTQLRQKMLEELQGRKSPRMCLAGWGCRWFDALTGLGVFRDRVIALWWRSIRRRSQTHRILMDTHSRFGSAMASSTACAPSLPDARFAATHLR